MKGIIGFWLVGLLALLPSTFIQPVALHAATVCRPTPRTGLGPFYKPDAPMRTAVGEGYVLRGVVRSAAGCNPLPSAMIEFWMAGPDGQYRDAYRARVVSGEDGRYEFHSHRPAGYTGRPPHIHIRVSAPGHRVLVTQHYPAAGQSDATFDLVLRPD